jgi:hypothetical protein
VGLERVILSVLERSTPCDPVPEIEVLFREARRRRRRRWLTGFVVLALVLAVIGAVLGAAGGGGGGSHRGASGQPDSARVVPVSQTAPAGVGVVGRGPTAIDFSDPDDGWIASGGVGLPTGNPTIVHTTDGGQSWERTPVPNLAAQAVNWQTNRAFGGLVGIHFKPAPGVVLPIRHRMADERRGHDVEQDAVPGERGVGRAHLSG